MIKKIHDILPLSEITGLKLKNIHSVEFIHYHSTKYIVRIWISEDEKIEVHFDEADILLDICTE